MKRLNILVLCDCHRNTASTIFDHANSFLKYSKHTTYHFNSARVRKPKWLDLGVFDVIIIHYSISVLWESYLNASWRHAVSASPALKVLFIQDEYREVHKVHERIREMDVRLLFTLASQDVAVQIYPPDQLPGLRLVTTLAGYVPSYIEEIPARPLRERPIDVGYRARGEGFWWLGSLFQDKARIGREFLRLAPRRGIRCDISTAENDRLYGRKWIRFLRNCRCTLGAESGASVVDFSGEIEENVKRYRKENPSASFEETKSRFFADVDGKIVYRGFSPRSFESVACGCALIMFEGDYFGILQPHVHYIPLRRDFSNFDEVCEKIRDYDFLLNMTQRTHAALIASQRFSYETFCKEADRQIEKAWEAMQASPSAPPVVAVESSADHTDAHNREHPSQTIPSWLYAKLQLVWRAIFNPGKAIRCVPSEMAACLRKMAIVILAVMLRFSPFHWYQEIRLRLGVGRLKRAKHLESNLPDTKGN